MLASKTVEEIFARMLARYGSAWRAKWQGVDPEAVKADWAMVLDGASFDSITYGLSYLPNDFAPSAGAFAELCRASPEKKLERLPAPRTPIPPRIAEKLGEAKAAIARRDPKAWAWELRDRELNHGGKLAHGDSMTAIQRAMWRFALEAQATMPVEDDRARTDLLKAETAKRVDEYARKFGLTLEGADTLLAAKRERKTIQVGFTSDAHLFPEEEEV